MLLIFSTPVLIIYICESLIQLFFCTDVFIVLFYCMELIADIKVLLYKPMPE